MTINRVLFRFCSYWCNWNVVYFHSDTRTLERSITPINPSCDREWYDPEDWCRLRDHSTPWDKDDIVVDTLPKDVFDRIVKHMGKEWLLAQIA